MKNLPETIGIDVSKSWLDVYIPGNKPRRIENSARAVSSLGQILPSDAIICLEASGGFERVACRVLSGLGLEVRLLNPRKVLRYADVVGQLAKTDALDARLIGLAGSVMPSYELKSADREALCDRSRQMTRLSRQIGELKILLERDSLDELTRESLHRELDFYSTEFKRMRAEIHAQLPKRPELFMKYRLLLSVKSIGQETARTLAAELPDDYTSLRPSQIASYAGLAPMDSSSGTREGRKRIRKGNTHIKRALYMAAMNAICHRTELKQIYAKLRAKGKDHQLAIVAIMRKLLLECVAVLKRKTNWVERQLAT